MAIGRSLSGEVITRILSRRACARICARQASGSMPLGVVAAGTLDVVADDPREPPLVLSEHRAHPIAAGSASPPRGERPTAAWRRRVIVTPS